MDSGFARYRSRPGMTRKFGARVIARILWRPRGGRCPFFLPPKRGMERREAPGVCETPLGRPCDRAARAPCEGARPGLSPGLRLPALHPSSLRGCRANLTAARIVGAPDPLGPPIPASTRGGGRSGNRTIFIVRNYVKRPGGAVSQFDCGGGQGLPSQQFS
jgi:hypothetical protein